MIIAAKGVASGAGPNAGIRHFATNGSSRKAYNTTAPGFVYGASPGDPNWPELCYPKAPHPHHEAQGRLHKPSLTRAPLDLRSLGTLMAMMQYRGAGSVPPIHTLGAAEH